MQYPLFGTLPEGHVETESIFMSIAAVGSSPNGAGLLRCLQSGEGWTLKAVGEERAQMETSKSVHKEREEGKGSVVYLLSGSM